MSGWEAVRLDELETIDVAGVHWRPVRRRFDIRAFGTNAYTADAGELVVEPHAESGGHEELYVVLRGRATFTIDGDELDAPAGTLVFLREPSLQRSAVAAEDGTAVLAVGGKPGVPYEVSAWEHSFAAAPFFASGDYDAAAATIAAGLVERPDHARLLYDLACAEARAGRVDEARAHLERAIEQDPKLREHATADDDLAALRQ